MVIVPTIENLEELCIRVSSGFSFFKSNERSEDSYIGLPEFFSGKNLKILMYFLSSIELHLLKMK